MISPLSTPHCSTSKKIISPVLDVHWHLLLATCSPSPQVGQLEKVKFWLFCSTQVPLISMCHTGQQLSEQVATSVSSPSQPQSVPIALEPSDLLVGSQNYSIVKTEAWYHTKTLSKDFQNQTLTGSHSFLSPTATSDWASGPWWPLRPRSNDPSTVLILRTIELTRFIFMIDRNLLTEYLITMRLPTLIEIAIWNISAVVWLLIFI